jgi:hypothetical protein
MSKILEFPEPAERPQQLAQRHPVYCAGCWAKGKRVQTGWSSLKGTSINCDDCNAEMKEETRRRFGDTDLHR